MVRHLKNNKKINSCRKERLLQYFHWYLPNDGNLWKQIKGEAQRLKDLGFSTLWFPPAFKGAAGGYSTGYDVYDLYDLGEFDQKGSVRTKYGTRQEYVEAIDAAHAAGLRVMVDIVLNHKAGGDEMEKINVVKVDPENRTKVISGPFEIEAFTKFTFPGRGKKYSEFEVIFYVENLKYRYGFRVTKGMVEEEWFYYSEPQKTRTALLF